MNRAWRNWIWHAQCLPCHRHCRTPVASKFVQSAITTRARVFSARTLLRSKLFLGSSIKPVRRWRCRPEVAAAKCRHTVRKPRAKMLIKRRACKVQCQLLSTQEMSYYIVIRRCRCVAFFVVGVGPGRAGKSTWVQSKCGQTTRSATGGKWFMQSVWTRSK